MTLLDTQLSRLSCYLQLFDKVFLDAQFSNTLSLRYSLNVRPETRIHKTIRMR